MAVTAYLYDPLYMRHDTGYGHPERPERLKAIDDRLKKSPFYKDLVRVKPRAAELATIELIHDRAYIDRVKREIEGGTQYLDSMDTVVCRESFDIALKAAGGGLAMCDSIMKGPARCGFCAVRPPGHHAERDLAAGFCIFNNIAIAARYLQKTHQLGKIAIIDWDVHHGNGTQHSFETDNSVLYISLHQFPHYPGTGADYEIGRGDGEDFTLNLPLRAGAGDADYERLFDEKIVPALDSFAPDIVLVSAGFDAHISDPLSSIRLSSAMFYGFTKKLCGVANRHAKGRIIAFLEGGYHLDALAESVEQMMTAFVED